MALKERQDEEKQRHDFKMKQLGLGISTRLCITKRVIDLGEFCVTPQIYKPALLALVFTGLSIGST